MFNRKCFKLSPAILVAALAPGASSAQAAVTYVYTGKDFRVFSSPSPFGSSDRVTGSVTFSAAFGNSVFSSASPTAFAFSDGAGEPITNLNYTSEAFFSKQTLGD